jgi:hypothetical protein
MDIFGYENMDEIQAPRQNITPPNLTPVGYCGMRNYYVAHQCQKG